jgi:hypothetical protein
MIGKDDVEEQHSGSSSSRGQDRTGQQDRRAEQFHLLFFSDCSHLSFSHQTVLGTMDEYLLANKLITQNCDLVIL